MKVQEIAAGVFVPFPNSQHKLFRISRTETVIVRREDGSKTQSDRACDGYSVEVRPPEVALAWPTKEQEAAGIFEAAAFRVPGGWRTVGEQRFMRIDGVVREVYDTEPLPPEPSRAEKVDAFLTSRGLTREEFLAELGLEPAGTIRA